MENRGERPDELNAWKRLNVYYRSKYCWAVTKLFDDRFTAVKTLIRTVRLDITEYRTEKKPLVGFRYKPSPNTTNV